MTSKRLDLGRLILVAVATALALSACGKRAPLRAPDGAEEAYTYPRVYPNPATVVPAGTPDPKLRSREIPGAAGDLSTFPNPRTKTTYGDSIAP